MQALSAQRVRGPAWACLVHRDSQDDPLARAFMQWLREQLGRSAVGTTPRQPVICVG